MVGHRGWSQRVAEGGCRLSQRVMEGGHGGWSWKVMEVVTEGGCRESRRVVAEGHRGWSQRVMEGGYGGSWRVTEGHGGWL